MRNTAMADALLTSIISHSYYIIRQESHLLANSVLYRPGGRHTGCAKRVLPRCGMCPGNKVVLYASHLSGIVQWYPKRKNSALIPSDCAENTVKFKFSAAARRLANPGLQESAGHLGVDQAVNFALCV